MIFRLCCWILLTVFARGLTVMGQGADELTRHLALGQDALYRLDYAEAERVFGEIIAQDPDNPVGHGMLAIARWNDLLFAAKNIVLDDYGTPNPLTKRPTYKDITDPRRRFLDANNRLLDVCEERLRQDPADSRALYFKGIVYENLAAEALGISKDSGRARTYGKRAANIHKAVLEIDPGLVDAQTSIAVIEFAAATLPWSIKWLAFLVGYRGDKEVALARLETVAEKGLYRKLDAKILLVLLHAWKGDPRRSVTILEEMRRRYPQNFLLDLNLAAIYELQLKDYQAALAVYQHLLDGLPGKTPGLRPGEVHYRMGRVYVRLRESTRALGAFNSALVESKVELETTPLTHFAIAQLYEDRGELERAKAAYEQVLRYDGPVLGLEEEIRYARRKVKR